MKNEIKNQITDTQKIIEGFYCCCNSFENQLIIREDLQRKKQRAISIGNYSFNAASFENTEQLDLFIRNFEIDIDKASKYICGNDFDGKITVYNCLNNFYNPLFWDVKDLPIGCKKIKALSNGSVVDCYFLKNGLDIIVFRPNPNAKKIYKPLEIGEHINHSRINGSF